MLNSGDKNNKYSKSCVVRKKNSERNKKNHNPLLQVKWSVPKLFEKIVDAQIYEYLIKYKLIQLNKSGFRSKHSCVTALTKIVDHILKKMDQGNYTGVLLLDFKKAFDMVNHTILFSKLKYINLMTYL